MNDVYPYNSNYKGKRPNKDVWVIENIVSNSGLASLFVAQSYNARICKNTLFNDNTLNYNNAGSILGVDPRYSLIFNPIIYPPLDYRRRLDYWIKFYTT